MPQRATRLRRAAAPTAGKLRDVEDENPASDSGEEYSSSDDEHQEPVARKSMKKRTVKSKKVKAPATKRAKKATGKRKVTKKKTSQPAKEGQNEEQHQDDQDEVEVEEVEEAQVTLYDVVHRGGGAVAMTIAEWIERYEDDKESAVLEIINMVLEASGSDIAVTPEDFAKEEPASILEDLLRSLQPVEDYPLVGKTKASKKLLKHYLDFFNRLVEEAKEAVFDDFLMETLINWLTSVSSASFRNFRHTATIAASQLLLCMIKLALTIRQESEVTEKQLNAAKKPRGQRSRIKDLQRTAEELEGKLITLQNLMNDIFHGVFVHRYRDVDPHIRATSIASLGEWIREYEIAFLDDQYLKYLGWTLSDTDATVRLASLSALLGLYANEDFCKRLELFSNRFQKRIVEMATGDVDAVVAERATEVVTFMMRYEALESNEEDGFYPIDLVCQEVFKNCASTRPAAAAFLREYLLDKEMGQDSQNIHSQLRTLVDYITSVDSTNEPKREPALLVDALWPNDLLQNWAAMTDLLLQDPEERDAFEDDAVGVLIRMFVLCAEKALGYSILPHSMDRKTDRPSKTQLAKVSETITTHCLTALPELFKRYKPDSEKVQELVRLLSHLDADVIEARRQQKVFKTLLRLTSEIFFVHSTETVLQNCVEVFKHFLTPADGPLAADTQLVFHELTTQVEESLKNQMADVFVDEDYGNLNVTLRRVERLLKSFPLDELEHREDVVALAEKIVEKAKSKSLTSTEEVTILRCISILWLSCLHQLAAVRSDEAIDAAKVSVLVSHRDTLVSLAQNLFASNGLSPDIRGELMITTGALLMAFAAAAKGNVPKDLEPVFLSAFSEEDPGELPMLLLEVFKEQLASVRSNPPDGDAYRRTFQVLRIMTGCIAQESLPVSLTGEVLAWYSLVDKRHSDMIKEFFHEMKRRHAGREAEFTIDALTTLFEEWLATREESIEVALVETAKRLSLGFQFQRGGRPQIETLKAIVKRGFSYSVQPSEQDADGRPIFSPDRLPFLGYVMLFVHKLKEKDLTPLVDEINLLDKGFDPAEFEDDDDFKPFFEFIAECEGRSRGEAVVHSPAHPTTKRKSSKRSGAAARAQSQARARAQEGEWVDKSTGKTQKLTDSPRLGRTKKSTQGSSRRGPRTTEAMVDDLFESDEPLQDDIVDEPTQETQMTQEFVQKEEEATEVAHPSPPRPKRRRTKQIELSESSAEASVGMEASDEPSFQDSQSPAIAPRRTRAHRG